MKENNEIFLTGGDALGYLAGTMHKKYSTRFVWGHPFSRYVSYNQFFNPLPKCAFRVHLPSPSFCVRDFIHLILSSIILNLLVCHSFLILFYLSNSRIDVFVSDTHHFLASHSVSSSHSWKTFPLMVTSNCQLFYLS